MKLLLIEKVEEVLSQRGKTPNGRCRLAELRLTRGRLLLSLEDEQAKKEGLEVLHIQAQVLSRLAKQGTPKAAKLLEDAQSLLRLS